MYMRSAMGWQRPHQFLGGNIYSYTMGAHPPLRAIALVHHDCCVHGGIIMPAKAPIAARKSSIDAMAYQAFCGGAIRNGALFLFQCMCSTPRTLLCPWHALAPSCDLLYCSSLICWETGRWVNIAGCRLQRNIVHNACISIFKITEQN